MGEPTTSPTKAILIVTHNIDEAVLLADRVLVLGANPGRIHAEVTVDLPRPRDRRSPGFEALVDQLYGILTGRGSRRRIDRDTRRRPHRPTHATARRQRRRAGRPARDRLAARRQRPTCPTSPTSSASKSTTCSRSSTPPPCSGFADVDDARIDHHRPDGRSSSPPTSSPASRSSPRRPPTRAPLVRTICKALAGTEDGNLRDGFFLDLLRRGFTADDARHQLEIAIDWGRYGELYDYDTVSDEITADPARASTPVNQRAPNRDPRGVVNAPAQLGSRRLISSAASAEAASTSTPSRNQLVLASPRIVS